MKKIKVSDVKISVDNFLLFLILGRKRNRGQAGEGGGPKIINNMKSLPMTFLLKWRRDF